MPATGAILPLRFFLLSRNSRVGRICPKTKTTSKRSPAEEPSPAGSGGRDVIRELVSPPPGRSPPSSMQERENSEAPKPRRHFSFAGAPSTFLSLVDERERERKKSEHSLAPFVRPPLLFRRNGRIARLAKSSRLPERSPGSAWLRESGHFSSKWTAKRRLVVFSFARSSTARSKIQTDPHFLTLHHCTL